MSMRVANIVIDCANPAAVGAFWSATMDGALETHIPNAFLSMKTSDGGSWFFLRVPEPKTAKNRMHVDLDSGGAREAEVSRLTGLGASVVAEKDEWGHRWTVLQDPEGNEFCVS